MNDDDDKTDARDEGEPRSDRWRRGAGAMHDHFEVRNTAPAGTPVHKLPAALPLGAPIAPEELGPPPVVKSASDRPPSAETITQTRTVGGRTARLKVPGLTDDEAPRARGRRAPMAVAPRPPDDEPPPSGRSAGERPGPRSARGASMPRREAPANWEAEVKLSEPELPAAKAKVAERAPEAALAGESRWPFAIALGAVAFAIGSLLPLPFRKYIVGSAPEPSQVQPLTIPLPGTVHSVAPTPPPATAATSAQAASSAAPAPSAVAPVDPGATKPIAPTAPSGASSAGKRPHGVKGNKGGPIGDIF